CERPAPVHPAAAVDHHQRDARVRADARRAAVVAADRHHERLARRRRLRGVAGGRRERILLPAEYGAAALPLLSRSREAMTPLAAAHDAERPPALPALATMHPASF